MWKKISTFERKYIYIRIVGVASAQRAKHCFVIVIYSFKSYLPLCQWVSGFKSESWLRVHISSDFCSEVALNINLLNISLEMCLTKIKTAYMTICSFFGGWRPLVDIIVYCFFNEWFSMAYNILLIFKMIFKYIRYSNQNFGPKFEFDFWGILPALVHHH